jgi:acyl-CoA thioesterase-1
MILLFMTAYRVPMGPGLSDQSWQSGIGTNYAAPMVSYADAVGPQITDGNITLAEITADGVHPTDLGHAYAAQFLEQNLQNAIENFPPGTSLAIIPPTQAPLYSSDFEYTSLQEGIGADGPALNPASNVGWIAQPYGSDPNLGPYEGAGLESSTIGSTLDFTVTGKEILLGYWVYGGPMGQVSVTVDGAAPVVLDSQLSGDAGNRAMNRVADSLASGPHQVHIDLLSTNDNGSTGNTFRLLCIGAGGVN